MGPLVALAVAAIVVTGGQYYEETRSFEKDTQFGSDLLNYARGEGKTEIKHYSATLIKSQVETFFSNELEYQTYALVKNSVDYNFIAEGLDQKNRTLKQLEQARSNSLRLWKFSFQNRERFEKMQEECLNTTLSTETYTPYFKKQHSNEIHFVTAEFGMDSNQTAQLGVMLGHELANLKNRKKLKKQNQQLAEALDLLESYTPSKKEQLEQLTQRCNQLHTQNIYLIQDLAEKIRSLEDSSRMLYLTTLNQHTELLLANYQEALAQDPTLKRVQEITNYNQALRFKSAVTRFLLENYNRNYLSKITTDELHRTEVILDSAKLYLKQLPAFKDLLNLSSRGSIEIKQEEQLLTALIDKITSRTKEMGIKL